MNILVGYTGFVGSNLYEYGTFDYVFNSKNIKEAYGLKPDLLIYAGLSAEKYLANNNPEKDRELITLAENNIAKIEPQKLVLISTIDVFKTPYNVDENTEIDASDLHAYGFNRYQLECWVRINYPEALIIRLPGLFGKNIKKNFIYDYMKRIPFMLKENKFEELSEKEKELKDFYERHDNGFYKCKNLDISEERKLKQIIIRTGFSALNFTDSRNEYQFYPLKRLWNDLQIALANDIRIWHPATEPVKVEELYKYLANGEFVNELEGIPISYNYKTIYSELFGGNNGYICYKEEVMSEIKKFIGGIKNEQEND